jgi:hypothetical protein
MDNEKRYRDLEANQTETHTTQEEKNLRFHVHVVASKKRCAFVVHGALQGCYLSSIHLEIHPSIHSCMHVFIWAFMNECEICLVEGNSIHASFKHA